MELSHDRHSFMIDGQRIWLMSGALHYFRVPAKLWRDRLLKARAAGLNCIETYVAWNFHEPREGEWNFSGDHDVAAFVRLAGELGLHVIVRPGPYICAEWDFGGFPAWLTTKPGIYYRSDEPSYTRCYERYLNELLPRLAPLQVTHGGPIILIQNENEYYMSSHPGCEAHIQHINQLFRANGFTVPIINCNRFSDTPAAGTIECINTWGTEVQDIKRMRARQPDAPLLVTEFWAGGFDTWGWPHRTRKPRETARRLLEIVGCGAQPNPYMWHGGTNFGFWGSRLIGSDAFYQCTSYDMDAPLAEGGGLTRKYFLMRLVTMPGSTLGRWLAPAALAAPAVHLHGGAALLALHGPEGDWVTVTNHGCEETREVRLSLPNGHELDVRLDHLGAVLLPVALRLRPDLRLDYSNAMPLGWFGERLLVLHAPAGAPVRFSLNGEAFAYTIPRAEDVQVIAHGAYRVVVLSSALAERCWWDGRRLVIGPHAIPGLGASAADDAQQPCWTIGTTGRLARREPAPAAPAAAPPRLGPWNCLGQTGEPAPLPGNATPLAWQPLAGPTDFDTLGNYYGYGWYRLEFERDAAGSEPLFLPDCGDRATLFANGRRAGVWGRGAGATREPLPVKLKRGRNTLALLVDNLGRFSHTDKMGELKGLWGPLWTARPLTVPRPRLQRLPGFDPAWIPRHQWHRVSESSTWRTLNDEPVWKLSYTLKDVPAAGLHVSFTGVPHNVAVLVNGQRVAFYPFYAPTFGDLTLRDELHAGRNTIEFILWGDVQPGVLDTLSLHALEQDISAGARWSFRPWAQPPQSLGPLLPASGRGAQAYPSWFRSEFPRDAANRPLYLSVGTAWKGQIYLNGFNIGRYWNIGPSGTYYLPECWMRTRNTLLLFDEAGRIPRGARLHLQPKLDRAPDTMQQASGFFTV